ncbi:hypothetical protein [Synechococcus sp. BA-132 BA5]|uniref:hypothetical protein n=1 Tax=Synechococcus sp. BA-132 BA5 TaxID=3110252 RepID=UPI002B1EF604|nr:hypothetical protein [Synechococcus sp. BA-132 BA5]MEA5414845.1 hypothetical protein [Synechococcus sp. BA-132 BA5]
MADQQALHAFAQWVAGCSGNEKQEGQTFVQKLLSAWAQAECIAQKAGMEDCRRYGQQLPRLQSAVLLNLLSVTK